MPWVETVFVSLLGCTGKRRGENPSIIVKSTLSGTLNYRAEIERERAIEREKNSLCKFWEFVL